MVAGDALYVPGAEGTGDADAVLGAGDGVETGDAVGSSTADTEICAADSGSAGVESKGCLQLEQKFASSIFSYPQFEHFIINYLKVTINKCWCARGDLNPHAHIGH